VPALRALRDDRTVVPWYGGSEQATLGICDFAADYLARILGQSLAFHPDFAARDREIPKLK
jgi:pyruvate-formate lyase-activating enzyme